MQLYKTGLALGLTSLFILYFGPLSSAEMLAQPIAESGDEIKAEKLLKRGQPDKVIELLQINAENLSRRGSLLLAQAYRQKKDTTNEIRALEFVTVRNPSDYYVETLVGDAFLAMGKADKAAAKYRHAIETNGKYRAAYDGLYNVLTKTKGFYEARLLMEDMAKRFKPEPFFYNELCRLYALEPHFPKALENCQKAVSLDPKFPDNHVYLAITYRDQNEEPLAKKIIKKAAADFKKSEMTQWTAGQFSEKENNFSAAFKYYEKAVAIDANSSRAHLSYAKMAFELDKLDASLKAYMKACKLDQKTIGDFKNAESKLKFAGKMDWYQRFSEGIGKCYL